MQNIRSEQVQSNKKGGFIRKKNRLFETNNKNLKGERIMKESRGLRSVVAVALVIVMCLGLVSTCFAYDTVRYGSRGTDVKTLQTMLNKVNNAGLTVDGIFGAGTRTAVRNYQSSRGLTVDGIAGKNTWNKLTNEYNNLVNKSTTTNSRPTLKNGSRGNSVKELQNMLNKANSSGLTVDGIFGSGTERAVRDFQSKNGLTVDGIVGSGTWNALEKAMNNSGTKNSQSTTSGTSVDYQKVSTATHQLQGSKECVLASISMLIRRELYLEGKGYSHITKSTVRQYNGGGTSARWSTIIDKANKKSGVSKTMTTQEMNGKGANANRNTVINILKAHPEGVVAYFRVNDSSQHAVLISNYDGKNFWVSDPASSNMKYVKLSDSWLWSKSDPGIFGSLYRIVYYK